jgi:hypothetical protein
MFDPVIDLLMRVKQAEPTFPDWKIDYIERQFRADWGASNPRIMPQSKIDRAARDRRIVETWQTGGATMRQIADKFGLKPTRICKIINNSVR